MFSALANDDSDASSDGAGTSASPPAPEPSSDDPDARAGRVADEREALEAIYGEDFSAAGPDQVALRLHARGAAAAASARPVAVELELALRLARLP